MLLEAISRGELGSRHTLHTVSRLVVNFLPPTLRLKISGPMSACRRVTANGSVPALNLLLPQFHDVGNVVIC